MSYKGMQEFLFCYISLLKSPLDIWKVFFIPLPWDKYSWNVFVQILIFIFCEA